MKLDLTREQREALENAADVIQDLIDFRTERKEDLLSKTYEVTGAHLLYLNEQIAELKSDINELLIIKHSMKCLTN